MSLASLIILVLLLVFFGLLWVYARKSFVYMIFILFLIVSIAPLVWLFYSSFKPALEISASQFAFPKEGTIANYTNAWSIGKLGDYFLNSIIYTVGTTFFVIIFGLMASFGFAKIKYKITGFFLGTFIIGILITLQSILIPLFLMERVVGLSGTRIGIILPYIGISLPLAVYLGTEYIKAIPDAIMESAQIDGAGYIKTFFGIVLPMTTPVASTIGIMTALTIWNEFMFVFVLSGSDATKSLPVGILSFSGAMSTEYGMQYAALMIGLLPILTVYLIFRNRITKGVVGGSLKE
jgi:raffinose/stachyose/melibiose transport system permease protein